MAHTTTGRGVSHRCQEAPGADRRRDLLAARDLRRRRGASARARRAAVVLAVIIGATFAFLSTEVGQQASLDQADAADGVVRRHGQRRAVRADGAHGAVRALLRAGFQLVVPPLMALIVAGTGLRGLQRRARRRRHLQAGLCHRRAFRRHPGRADAVRGCRSTTRAKRCRARRTSRVLAVPRRKHRSRRGCWVDRFVPDLVDGQPRHRFRRPLPAADGADCDHAARHLRGDRVDDRGRQNGARQESR